jgi:hypothetical protein
LSADIFDPTTKHPDELLDTIPGLQDILVDRLEFDLPCEHPDCEQDAVWALKCLRCGDAVMFCQEHKDGLMAFLNRLAFHTALIGCTVCGAGAPTFAKVMVWIPLRGAQ